MKQPDVQRTTRPSQVGPILTVTRWVYATAYVGASVLFAVCGLALLVFGGIEVFQAIDPSVTVPYWKFDVPAPNIFRDDFMGANQGGGGPWAPVVFAPANPLNGWTITTLAGIPMTEQFTIFGASGAITFSALSGLLLHRLLSTDHAHCGNIDTAPTKTQSATW